MNIQYGPIRQWPGKLRTGRISSPFKSSYANTMKLLETELRQAAADTPVVQLAIRQDQWRKDGRPYESAKHIHPGVIVSFMKKVRAATGVHRVPLAFPCDRFTAWEDNIRAVALALEALRKVDRYGVTQNSEQYTGFRALPPPGPSHEAIVTVEDAAKFMAGGVSGCVAADLLASAEKVRRAYREKAGTLHPDTNNGIHRPEWAMLQAAKTLLDAHHGL